MSQKFPNVILMVLDTVGAKHLSLYGYQRPTTPNLEKIARECSVYTRCFAPACWTVPSHGSIFTGLYPSQHGAFENTFVLRGNLPHLVSTLKAQGYATIGISTNALVSPASGLCRDFDEFHDLGSRGHSRIMAEFLCSAGVKAGRGNLPDCLRTAVSPRQALMSLLHYLWETGRTGEVLKASLKMAARQAMRRLRPNPIDNATPYTRKTLRLIDEVLKRQASADSPFFLFVNILQAHQNYRPPLRWRRFSSWRDRAVVSPQKFYLQRKVSQEMNKLMTTYGNLYDDEILFLDSVIGRLWELFQATSLLKNTVVVITSDHGEHFGEKGHYTHILSLYNELLWVPLLIRFPQGLSRPGLDRRLVSLNDLYATILDLADSPMPRPETSYSLLAPPRRKLALAQCVYPEMWRRYLDSKKRLHHCRGESFSPPVFAVMTDPGLKLIGKRDGSLEVYDLNENFNETLDLAPNLPPAVLARYQDLLEVLKTETGFHEVTAVMQARTDRLAA